MHLVFMGVSGSGKSTIAGAVAHKLDLPFAEADEFHPPANVSKMSRGVPLDDADREPWLRALATWIRAHEERGTSTVMACSALRRRYRDVLREGAPGVRFLHLHAPAEVFEERMRQRSDHFMPLALLRSQVETLETLEPGEDGRVLDAALPAEELIGQVLAEYGHGERPA